MYVYVVNICMCVNYLLIIKVYFAVATTKHLLKSLKWRKHLLTFNRLKHHLSFEPLLQRFHSLLHTVYVCMRVVGASVWFSRLIIKFYRRAQQRSGKNSTSVEYVSISSTNESSVLKIKKKKVLYIWIWNLCEMCCILP